MMKVVFTDAARADMRAIKAYIRQESPIRAATYVSDLVDKCLSLGTYPNRYETWDAVRYPGVRRCVFGPYLIFYRVISDAVVILHVLHGARDVARVLGEEGV